MAATEAVPSTNVSSLDDLLQTVAKSFSEEEMKDAINWTKNFLLGEYTKLPEDDLSKCFDLLKQHGRVSERDTSGVEFFAEKFCKEEKTKSLISKEIKRYKEKHYQAQQDTPSKVQLIGRDEDVHNILEELQGRVPAQADSGSGNIRAINLYGEGGVGKTCLAEGVARQLCAISDCKSIVVSLRDIKDMDHIYFEVLKHFGRTAVLCSPERVYSIIESLPHKLVLVFDNTEEHFWNLQKFRDFLTKMIQHDKQERLQVLLTSRVKLPGVSNYLVKPFSQEESKEILLQKTGFHSNVSLMSQIADLCCNKPLLLIGIAGILKEKLTKEEDVLVRVENNISKGSSKMTKERALERQTETKQPTTELGINDKAVFQEVFSTLSEPLRNSLVNLSFFCREFPLSEAQQMFDRSTKEIQWCLDILISKGCVEPKRDEHGQKMYELHPLMQTFLQGAVKNTPEYQAVYQEAKHLFCSLFRNKLKELVQSLDRDFIQVLSDFEKDRPNFEQLLKLSPEKEFLTLLPDVREFYLLPCLLEPLITVGEREYLFHKLADTAVKEGNWSFAANLKSWEALQVNQQRGGKEARVVLNEAESFLKKEPEQLSDQYQGAKSMYLYVKGKTYYNSGHSEATQKSFYCHKALESLNQSLELTEKVYGRHTATARCLNGMGNCYNELQNLEMALTYYKMAYKMRKELSGSNGHNDMTVYLNQIAVIHEKTGVKLLKEKKSEVEGKRKLAMAIEMYLDIEIKLTIDGYSNKALFKRNMANAYLHLEETEKAWKAALEAYEIRQRVLGTHPDTVKSLFQLGNVKFLVEDYPAALEYFYKAHEMEESLPAGNNSAVRQLIKEKIVASGGTISDGMPDKILDKDSNTGQLDNEKYRGTKRKLGDTHKQVEQELFSETFRVGAEGKCLSFCGCVVDIPPGALSCETSICLSIEQVDPPGGICVTPILHCEPDGLKFNQDIEVTLPLNGRPYEPVEKANLPELELMVRGSTEERWCCDRVQKLSFSGMSYSCRHFSWFAWSWTLEGFVTGKFWLKNISCSLFERKDGCQTTTLKLAVCETFLEDMVIKKIKECGFCIRDRAGTVPVVWGQDLAIRAETGTSVKVKPIEEEIDRQLFKNRCETSVSFTLQWVDFGETEAKVVFIVDNHETQKSYPKLTTTLHKSNFSLQIEKDVQPLDEPTSLEQKEEKDCATDSSKKIEAPNTGCEDKQSNSGPPKIDVLLICDEWGSSRGGLSTFNRQLAVHLAREEEILNIHCYLSEVSDPDRKSASDNNVKLIKAEPVSGSSDPFERLQKLPPELPRPDIVIGHGRKFGTAAHSIHEQCKSSKWVHFVHVDCLELAKYKKDPKAMSKNNSKDLDEVQCCKGADLVVAVGPHLAEKYKSALVRAKPEVEMFIPGISEEFLDMPQSTEDKRKFHVYMFGRGSQEDFHLKGFDIAAAAVAQLGEEYNLYAVGAIPGQEDTFKKYFFETEAENNINVDQLNVIGYCNDREELKDLMCKADVVIMPSRAEAFGLIGLEALSAGVPVLVSAVSGLGIVMKDLVHGDTCVVESHQPEDWAKKIESLLKKKRSLRNAEARDLRAKYGEAHCWDKECSKLTRLFCSFTGRDYGVNHS